MNVPHKQQRASKCRCERLVCNRSPRVVQGKKLDCVAVCNGKYGTDDVYVHTSVLNITGVLKNPMYVFVDVNIRFLIPR